MSRIIEHIHNNVLSTLYNKTTKESQTLQHIIVRLKTYKNRKKKKKKSEVKNNNE